MRWTWAAGALLAVVIALAPGEKAWGVGGRAGVGVWIGPGAHPGLHLGAVAPSPALGPWGPRGGPAWRWPHVPHRVVAPPVVLVPSDPPPRLAVPPRVPAYPMPYGREDFPWPESAAPARPTPGSSAAGCRTVWVSGRYQVGWLPDGRYVTVWVPGRSHEVCP